MAIACCSGAAAQSPVPSRFTRHRWSSRTTIALFQQMYKNPSNLEASFKFAEQAVKRGDYEAAIGALERMLFFNPNLPRVKLELGVYISNLAHTNSRAVIFKRRSRRPTLLTTSGHRSAPI